MDERRPRSTPRQWCLMAEGTPPWRRIETAEKYHRWHEAGEMLADKKVISPGPRRDLLLALLYLKTARPDLAGDCALRGLQADPGDAELHMVAAAACLQNLRLTGLSDWAYATTDHCLAARNDGRFRNNALRMLAEVDLLQGRLGQARQALEALRTGGASDPDTLALLAGTCRHCGDPAAAAKVLQDVERGPWPHLPGEAWLLTGEDLPVGQMPAGDDPCAVAHRAECILEWLMLYWRVRWLDDLERLLEHACRSFPAVANHPVAHLLLADVASERGRRRSARAHARRADRCGVDFVAPARWEDAELLRRGIALLGDGAGRLRYLLGLFLAENDQVDRAATLLKRAVGPKCPASLRRLAAKALADWAAAVNGDLPASLRRLRTAFRAGGPDRRLIIAMDNTMHQMHDIAGRPRLFKHLPDSLRGRGDIAFHLARLAFDRGRYAETIDTLTCMQFSVYEGGGAVRRLYVDALLVATLDRMLAGKASDAERSCRAVLEYPENLGAAVCLGEHSRLARFLLGQLAWNAGNKAAARTWWRDVVSRKDASAVYATGDPLASQLGRTDELLARDLARKGLGRNVRNSAIKVKRPENDPVDLACTAVATAISAGSPSSVAKAERAFRQYPCSPLARILLGLARLGRLGK